MNPHKTDHDLAIELRRLGQEVTIPDSGDSISPASRMRYLLLWLKLFGIEYASICRSERQDRS